MTPKNPRQKTKGPCWVEPGWGPRGPEALLGALGPQEHCWSTLTHVLLSLRPWETEAQRDWLPRSLMRPQVRGERKQGQQPSVPLPELWTSLPHAGVPPTSSWSVALCWMRGPGVSQLHTTCWERMKGLGVGVQQLLR